MTLKGNFLLEAAVRLWNTSSREVKKTCMGFKVALCGTVKHMKKVSERPVSTNFCFTYSLIPGSLPLRQKLPNVVLLTEKSFLKLTFPKQRDEIFLSVAIRQIYR